MDKGHFQYFYGILNFHLFSPLDFIDRTFYVKKGIRVNWRLVIVDNDMDGNLITESTNILQ